MMKKKKKESKGKEVGNEKKKKKKKKQSQKRYTVSDSLCLINFIDVEFKVSLVVSGQRPRRGRCPFSQRKWATEAAWRASG